MNKTSAKKLNIELNYMLSIILTGDEWINIRVKHLYCLKVGIFISSAAQIHLECDIHGNQDFSVTYPLSSSVFFFSSTWLETPLLYFALLLILFHVLTLPVYYFPRTSQLVLLTLGCLSCCWWRNRSCCSHGNLPGKAKLAEGLTPCKLRCVNFL